MSNHLAVATVTAALGQLVHASAQSAVNGVMLQFGRPVAQGAGLPDRRVHVYLYQVSPNAALRNADLPTRNTEGRVTQRPKAALELHYLLTFYGNDQLLEPDRMLAAVARDLHARPLLTNQNVADAIGSHSPELAGSDLAAAEQVRFTPMTLTLDEQSKLWSVMLQTPHALSMLYTASVVLLDALEQGTPALPVLRRGEQDRGPEATAGSFPSLDDGWVGFVASADRQPRLPSLRAAPLGSRVVIDGNNLGGDALTLRFSHPLLPVQEIGIPTEDRSAVQVRLNLPDDAPAQTAWVAGLYSVIASVQRGGASRQSPAWPLLVAPRITGIAPNPAARQDGAAGQDKKVTLSISCRPKLLPGQTATLLLAGREVPARPHPQVTDTIEFLIDAAPAVTGQLVWLRVDGAESQPMQIDPRTGLLVFDDAQRVTIT